MTTLRPYAGPSDLPALMELLLACLAGGYADMDFRSIELRILLSDPTLDGLGRAVLVEDDSALLGFGVLWGGHFLGALVHPRARGIVEPQLVEWATERARAQGLTRVGALCRDDDELGLSVLSELGYQTLEAELRMARDLALPIPTPRPPVGFSIRPLDPDRELDAWLTLYAEAIGNREHILRKWRAYRSDPDYDRALDLVAIGADGRLAGACTSTFARAEFGRLPIKEGRTEPIMVRANWRGRGLGAALVFSGLRLLRRRGMDIATLTTESDNLRAHKFYAALGYRTIYHGLWMERRL